MSVSPVVNAIPPLTMLLLNGVVTYAVIRHGRGLAHRRALAILAAAPAIYGLGVLLALVFAEPISPSKGPSQVRLVQTPAKPIVVPDAPRNRVVLETGEGPKRLWTPGLAFAAVGTFAIPLALTATVVASRAALGLLTALAATSWLLMWVPALRSPKFPEELVLVAYVLLAGTASLLGLAARRASGVERRAHLVTLPLYALGVSWLLLRTHGAKQPVLTSSLLVAAEIALLVLVADRLGVKGPPSQRTRAVQMLLLALGALLLVVVLRNLNLFPADAGIGPAVAVVAMATGMSVGYAQLRPRLDAWLMKALYPEAHAAQQRARALQAELEATRERLRDAEHLSLVGQLAAQVAHEIKNPLGPIKGYARIIERELERQGALSDVVARGIAVIKEEVEAIDGRARGLLEAARPPQPTLEPLDLRRAIGDVLALQRGDWPAGVLLDWTPPADEAPCETDRLLLRSALTNVLQNALSVVGPTGSVRVTLEAEPSTGAWLVRVDDSGPGLPEGEDPERLFRPFGSRRQGGHGLGLVIARGALRALGGELTLASRTDARGARATLRVPTGPAAPTQPPPAPAATPVPALTPPAGVVREPAPPADAPEPTTALAARGPA